MGQSCGINQTGTFCGVVVGKNKFACLIVSIDEDAAVGEDQGKAAPS